jgi:hypothetical protein
MSPARRRHGVTGQDRRQAHIDWLKLIEVSGPFLSVPVLTAEWPDLEPMENKDRDRLRQEHRQWQERPAAHRDDWIAYVLDDLLGWRGAVRYDDLAPLALDVPEHETAITPSFALTDPGTGGLRLLGLISDDSPVARIKGSDWPATPADRLAQLCRHHGVELGLATDGRWWALVWAPAGGVTTVAVFDAISWPDLSERTVVRAVLSLLQRRRFFAVPPERQLVALLRESLNNQEEITDRLGIQVRQAVELLVASFGRADISADVTAYEVYRGAVAVMMRIVFLLFAEESGLLPADNELYARAYSAAGLYTELEQRVADARGNEGELEHTVLAWHRLLALFTVVYRGVSHPELDLIAHDGSLFDPDAHLWLPLTVDDRTVLHMLRAVQTVTIASELRTVSFRTLTVEQIGYVYEGLLSFEGFRAAEAVVGLIGKDGREEEVPLRMLESTAAAHVSAETLAAKLAEQYKDSGIGSPRALTLKLASLTGDERAQAEARLYAVTPDHLLVQRLLPFYRIIRQDLRGDPVVILPGALYVTESSLRASTGTHYTPRFLAEQVAEGALDPLVYSPGPLQTADRSKWKLRTAEEILALRVADIAMGSGAFLVAACRYLADKLIEAWSAAGNVDAQAHLAELPVESGLALDVAADPLVIKARRQILEHCLYGVDINEMAVEMAKLSLWLVSMDPHRPFTFLDDRLASGDSLLGITSIDQLEWMHLDIKAGRKLHEGTLLDFMSGVRTLLAEVTEQRVNLANLPDDTFADLTKKRQLLADVQAKTQQLTLYADLIVGAALASSGKGGLWITAAKLAHDAATQCTVGETEEQVGAWLSTDQPDGAFNRHPLHWPLVFPEVFDPARSGGPGFDAIIGNPPFLGGSKISGSLGSAYREYLVPVIAHGVKGVADLIAYFVLRTHALLNMGGQVGLIATNTLAQGDTREVGLDQIIATGTEIRQAIKSRPWPSKSAVLEYAAVWTSRYPVGPGAERLADGVAVTGIAASLDPASQVSGNPHRLAAYAHKSSKGSFVLGLGFTMDSKRARHLIDQDSRNAVVILPYLNGQDLNSSLDCSASRWIINFYDWPEEEARKYPDCYSQIYRLVRPERQEVKFSKHARESWWQYERQRLELYRAISKLERVIVIAQTSSTQKPVIVPTRQVFDQKLVVFVSDDLALFTLLSSNVHYWWIEKRGSTLKRDLVYIQSDVFETFPQPELTAEMRELGAFLDTFRRNVMLARQVGLTGTYNLVHDQRSTDADIAELREIHRAIDEDVVRAYGWDDLLAAGLDHGFHDTRQGPRYTIGARVRQEILDRLLELNHERYAAEVKAGLHDKRGRKRSTQASDTTLF